MLRAFLTVAIVAVGAVGAVLIWAGTQPTSQQRVTQGILDCQYDVEKSLVVSSRHRWDRDLAAGKLGELCMRKGHFVPMDVGLESVCVVTEPTNGTASFRKLIDYCWLLKTVKG